MLSSLVLNDPLWKALAYAPFVLAFIAGVSITASFVGRRGWQPRCRRCKHDLRSSIESSACPECGADLTRRRAVIAGVRQVGWSLLVVGLGVAALSALMAPLAPLSIARCRGLLARQLSDHDVLEARFDGGPGSSTARSEVERRIARAEPAFVQAAIDNIVEQLKARPTKGIFDVVRKLNDAQALTPKDHDVIIAALGDAIESGAAAPQQALASIGLFRNDGDDPYLRAFIARPKLVDQLVEVRVSPETITEQSGFITISANAMTLLLKARLSIDRVAYRPTKTDEWIDAVVDRDRGLNISASQSRQWRTSLPPAGNYELRCEGTLRSEDGAVSSPFSKVVPLVIVDSASLPLEPMRGAEARTAVDPILRSLRLSVSTEDTFKSASLLREPTRGKKSSDLDIVIVGDVEAGQNDSWQRIATIFLRRNGYSFSNWLDVDHPLAMDPTQPFTLRIRPNGESIRKIDASVRRYLAEEVQLKFPRADSAPTEIVWPGDAPIK